MSDISRTGSQYWDVSLLGASIALLIFKDKTDCFVDAAVGGDGKND